MNVGQLKHILEKVPDDFEVRIRDVNFGDAAEVIHASDITVERDIQCVLFPGTTQQYLD